MEEEEVYSLLSKFTTPTITTIVSVATITTIISVATITKASTLNIRNSNSNSNNNKNCMLLN